MTEFLGELLAGIIRYALYIVEALAVLAVIGIARRNPCIAGKWFRNVEARFHQFARRRGLAVAAVGLLPLVIRTALLPILPPRLPAIADELSYVLAGNTFALGRVTNPPHPMSNYFESPHVLQHPTYMSMYFPAHGLFLAAGKLIAGGQYVGVWLSIALMCAAICWMLQAWLPPAWALLGGLLAVMRLGLFGYWMNSYFGGSVPALGGALMLGALPRIMRKQRFLDATLFALGLALLASSRPYEGFILALPAGCLLLFWITRSSRPPARVLVLRLALPLFVILAATGAATCYYYWRVTGSPFHMPQALRERQAMVVPYFIWQSPKPEPVYASAALRAFYVNAQMRDFRGMRTIQGWLRTMLVRLRDFWLFYLGPVLTLPLVALPWALKDKRIRFLSIAGAVFFVPLGASVWFYPHYAAPATALLYALLLQCIRHLRVWRWGGRPSGVLLARGIAVICVLMVIVRVGAQPLSAFFPLDLPATWFSTRTGGVYRDEILRQLRNQGGQHLILVRWRPGDNEFEQWVYNEPDIDRATVVWAWEPDHPDELLRYFKGRRVWLLRVAWQGPPALSPYSEPKAH